MPENPYSPPNTGFEQIDSPQPDLDTEFSPWTCATKSLFFFRSGGHCSGRDLGVRGNVRPNGRLVGLPAHWDSLGTLHRTNSDFTSATHRVDARQRYCGWRKPCNWNHDSSESSNAISGLASGWTTVSMDLGDFHYATDSCKCGNDFNDSEIYKDSDMETNCGIRAAYAADHRSCMGCY